MQAENRMLPARDILSFISRKYPYFKMVVKKRGSWKDFIRSCLTMTSYFEKIPNPNKGGKGNFWKMNLHLKNNKKKKEKGRPKMLGAELDLEKARAMMAKRFLRVELEDIGTAIVPKLFAVQNGDDDNDDNTERARNRKRREVSD